MVVDFSSVGFSVEPKLLGHKSLLLLQE